MDKENSLSRYMDHFRLTQQQIDGNGVLTQVFKSDVIGDIAESIAPSRQNITGRVPFNLMNPEQLLWAMQDTDYPKIVTHRERRGTSHDLSIRMARGVYYRTGSRNLPPGSDTGRPPRTSVNLERRFRHRNRHGRRNQIANSQGTPHCGTRHVAAGTRHWQEPRAENFNIAIDFWME